MIVSFFSILEKHDRVRFFEKSIFLTDVRPDIMLNMSFLTISNINVDFQAQDL